MSTAGVSTQCSRQGTRSLTWTPLPWCRPWPR
jgi:hypothetical protein